MKPALATRLFLPALITAPALAAAPQQAPEKPANPVTLVSRAEKLIQKGHKEDGALLLWQALDLLRGKASNPVEEATVLSARYLLKENDPFEMERRTAFTTVATTQTELAKSYRIKKWYDTAQNRLDVAARFDPEAITKEQATLTSKRGSSKKAATATKKPRAKADKPKAPAVSPLLREKAVQYQYGSWTETEDGLRVTPLNNKKHCEWICSQEHEEHEIVVELKPDKPDGEWNASLAVGQRKLSGTEFFSGLRCYVSYDPKSKMLQLFVQRVVRNDMKYLGVKSVNCKPAKDGFHLLAVRVTDAQVEFQVDGEPATVVKTDEPTRGAVGLMQGLSNVQSCGILFRNFQIRPLPTDLPSDEELREEAEATRQHEITAAVEDAKKLLTGKKHEAAALRLRDSLSLLQELPAGILRTNMEKSIAGMLKKADKLMKKRERAADTCANAFGTLADKYVADGRPRLALVMTREAMRFDPDGQAARLASVEKAVAEWNAEQLTLHAAELSPPKDDGTQLRAWFENNRLLDSRSAPWIVQGASARAEQTKGRPTVLMPQKQSLAAGTVDVHVHLPAAGCQGGIAFDAAGPHDYSIVYLSRSKSRLVLSIARWAGGKWIYLGRNTIPLDPWRLEGWHHIQLETAPNGIQVKVGETELKVDRKRLGIANARIGLYAAGADSGQAVEIRAFAAKAK